MEKNYARETGHAEGLAAGLAEGRAEGRAEGAAKTSREIAAKMKAKRTPMAEIAEITGLSEEEIAGLKAL